MNIIRFIFPQNYTFTNKLLGIMDYTTAIFISIWCALIFLILNFFITNLSIKLFLFIIFCFPVFLLSLVGLNNENIVYVIFYLIKFLIKNKLLLFIK